MRIRREDLRKSGFPGTRNPRKSLGFEAKSLGQSCPQRYPYLAGDDGALTDALGDPLSIHAAAELIGCSAWTVRQRYLPAGLPHHRLTPNGKLIFYRNQVIRWLITRQQKGSAS